MPRINPSGACSCTSHGGGRCRASGGRSDDRHSAHGGNRGGHHVVIVVTVAIGIVVAPVRRPRRRPGLRRSGGGAAHLVAEDLAAGCTRAAADRGFRLVAAACAMAPPAAPPRPPPAAPVLPPTAWPTAVPNTRAPPTPARVSPSAGGATHQRKGQQGIEEYFIERISVGMLEAILGSCEGSDKGVPTSNTTFIKYCKYLIYGRTFSILGGLSVIPGFRF